MKSVKMIVVALMVTGLIAGVSAKTFADEAQERAEIKALNNSAVALMKTNPNMALKLVQLATQKTQKIEGTQLAENKATTEAGNSSKNELLRASAKALKKDYPDLAKQLTAMAAQKDGKQKSVK